MTGGTLKLQSSAGYSVDGDHTTRVRNANNQVVEYTYNTSDERLAATSVKVTDANGNEVARSTTEYTYDNAGRTTQTVLKDPTNTLATIGNTYTNGRLSALTRTSYRNGAAQTQSYGFTYNSWGQSTAISVGNINLATYEYEVNGGNLTKMTYGNADSVSYFYDNLDRLIQTVYNDTGRYVDYSYNSEGVLTKLTYCNANGSQIAAYLFEYDSLGRLIRSTEYGANDTLTQRTEHLYDAYSRLSSQSWIIQGDSFSESYAYDDPDPDVEDDTADGSLKQMTTAIGSTIDFTYDVLKRLQKTTAKSATGSTILTNAYSYYNLGTTNSVTQTTSQVKFHNVRTANETLLTGAMYTYDEVGNIIQISESSSPYNPIVKYTYDVQNQLIKEVYYDGDGNADTNITATYEYTYDTAGNIITESKDGTVTETYTYGNSDWNDLLTAYDGSKIAYEGQTVTTSTRLGVVTYNVSGTPISGNPISYYNGNRWSFEWEQGRNLKLGFNSKSNTTLTSTSRVDTETTLNYSYDLDGIRTSKTSVVKEYGYTTSSGGVASIGENTVEPNATSYTRYLIGTTTVQHSYVTQNGKVVRETIGSGTTTKVLDFIYDSNGKPFALKYTNGTATPVTYYYVVNLQGDVVKLITESGAEVASYTYNAWGEVLTATGTMAEINPLRYRGYYYDTETGFYYLQSRYYDPVMHRFINADSLASTGQGILGTNMFAYCNDCPVRYIDPSGDRFIAADERYYSNGLYAYTDSGSGRYVSCQQPIYLVQHGNSEITNCFALCLGADNWVNQGSLSRQSPGRNLEDAARVTMDDVRALGWDIREVNGNDSPLMEGEYMIALRVGIADYHYMIKHDGSWWQKNGGLPIQQLGDIDPATFSWDKPCYSLMNFDGNRTEALILGYYKNYYNSKTKFFAIKPN